MKKLIPLILITLLAACMRESEPVIATFQENWKFKTGDAPEWAATGFDDSGWGTIHPGNIWENQGFKDHDGFAWYRTSLILPIRMKDKAFMKDSLQILLGKIDDCDQVFLNGELIGENGKTIHGKVQPGNEFIKEKGKWYMARRYVLGAADPRIRWDQENIVAIRVYDQNGAGGIFDKPFTISMVGIRDYLTFDFSKTSWIIEGDSLVGKMFTLKNSSRVKDYRGQLSIRASGYKNGIFMFQKDTLLTIPKQGEQEVRFSFSAPLSEPMRAELVFTEIGSCATVTGHLELPYLLTPSPSCKPKLTGARIFGVRPYSPFFFKVPSTGMKPLVYEADSLPSGLRINAETGIITGMLTKKGEHLVTLKVSNEHGTDLRELKIVVGDLISLTPPMGWNSWNCWGLAVSDEKVRNSAAGMVSSGLIDHGWTYINIDDGWEDTHDKDGKILTNYKFPNMRGLADHIHAMGLKIGIYSSPGPKTCGGYEGSYTFEEEDAKTYAAWGIDYLKYDWCSYWNIAPDPSPPQMKYPYKVMERAIRKTGRDIHYSLCQYGMGNVWEWGAEVNGNSWRTTGDITDTWESMSGIGFGQDECAPFAGPGRWNDPDMLVVGWVGWGPALHYTRLTPHEQYTHISLWCLLASPLLIGCDLNQLDPFTLNLLTNDEVLAVNQDPLGQQAVRIRKTDHYEVWARDLEDGSLAVGLFNKSDRPLSVPVDLKNLDISGKWEMRDLWSQVDLGKVQTHFEMKTLPHGARLVRLSH
jgi:hypothetical protein